MVSVWKVKVIGLMFKVIEPMVKVIGKGQGHWSGAEHRSYFEVIEPMILF